MEIGFDPLFDGADCEGVAVTVKRTTSMLKVKPLVGTGVTVNRFGTAVDAAPFESAVESELVR